MKKKKTKIILLTTGLILLSMMAYLLYHQFKTWPEEKFIGSNIADLEQYLESKGETLYNANGPFSINKRIDFEDLSGKKIKKNQKLFHFWAGKEYEHWHFPMGTVSYGAYVLVEDGVIIYFKKNKSVDSL